MELRSYNVERIYSECVKCSIGNDLGINMEKFCPSREHQM